MAHQQESPVEDMKRYTGIPTLGLDAIALIFIPSYLVYAGLIDAAALSTVRTAVSGTNVIPLFISVLIIGSILSIDRQTLFGNLAQIILPLVVASVAATAVGTAIGVAVGLTWFNALFMVVAPVMAGGVNAGVLPLSAGYSKVLGSPSGEILAHLLPPVILGNLVSMMYAGILNFIDRRFSKADSDTLKEYAQLVDETATSMKPAGRVVASNNIYTLGVAVVLIAIFTFAGSLTSRSIGLSEPLVLLVFAGLLQATDILSEKVRRGIVAVYRFCVAVLTYPVLILVGLLFTPWDTLIGGFSSANLLIVVGTVGTLAGIGYLSVRCIALNPVDGVTVALTRAAMGGTGDIAILSAARRLDLMPFAQIATRVGGAATVLAALVAAEHFGG